MPYALTDKLVIAISSRALFDLDDCHAVYGQEGVDAYTSYQIGHEDKPLAPGVAFPLVKKLLLLNRGIQGRQRVEVILLSRNSADTGLRIFNSIKHHGLDITRAASTRGENTTPYVGSFRAHLFLSANADDVRDALAGGQAAAFLLPSAPPEIARDQVRIAFDGDAVIFSDESEAIFQTQGLDAFIRNETESARTPLAGGPFVPFLSALQRIQQEDGALIRTALITARGAPAHERVVRTLRAWNIRIDEALFFGGLEKGPFLKAFGADIFFDDQQSHCDSARQHVATGHVSSKPDISN